MATTGISPSSKAIITVALLSWVFMISWGDSQHQKVYIVYMGHRPKGDIATSAQHKSMLQETMGSTRATDSWLYSYTKSFSGFAAKLTEAESKKIANMEGVVSVFPNTKTGLHTTRSWEFMGLPENVARTQTESDIIVGIIDSGIWPESPSFNDTGLGPPPSKWKGICQSSSNFTCNNKIIGARYYGSGEDLGPADILSPRDIVGHGTHTASTVAGGVVSGANLYGLAAGTARGGVPSARIAVYKVCYSNGCSDLDMLAAFDDAIADGVDIISVSAGGDSPRPYSADPIAIGAFHAMRNGILTSTSAGNLGLPNTIYNVAPWAISVAASTMDRKFLTKVHLGNNITYEGVSLNTFTPKDEGYPLVYQGNVQGTAQDYDIFMPGFGLEGSLDPKLVNGTIVLYDVLDDSLAGAAAAGATGVIIRDDNSAEARSFVLPASSLVSPYGDQVLDYINQTSKPTATIFKSDQVNETLAPFVASFSSKGPNPITKQILKPDLTAPGVDILAAWSEATTVTGNPIDPRVVPYNIISGTSMACPHATAAAAYVKSFNPTWSPAAIKSALMTTATPMNKTKDGDAEFAYGSGHINPAKAKSPGLVYDIEEADYIKFLCGEGYDEFELKHITGENVTCAGNITVNDLNYPSFAVVDEPEILANGAVFHRVVTNVGSPSSTYKAMVTAEAGLSVRVQPDTLSFAVLGEKQSFVITVNSTVRIGVLSGSLVWDDGTFQVRSPIIASVY